MDDVLQAVITAPRSLAFHSIPRPVPASDEALVRVARIGVCGSDLHVWHGEHPYATYPLVQGHEVVGTVVEVGDEVRGLAPGDHVAIRPQVTCGVCRLCTTGREHICDRLRVMGFLAPGAAQQVVAVPVANLELVPQHVPFDRAVLVEPVAVAVHAVSKAAPVPGTSFLVIGAGTIGLLVAQFALAQGATTVVISDPGEEKRALSRACGVSFALDPSDPELERDLAHILPDGPDVIVECVGSESSLAQALRLAPKGSRLVVLGVFGHPPRVDIGRVQNRELQVVGSLMYSRSDFAQAVELVASGRVELDALIGARFPFLRYAEAYTAIDADRGRLVKAIIVVQDEDAVVLDGGRPG